VGKCQVTNEHVQNLTDKASAIFENIWDEWINMNATEYFVPKAKDMEEKIKVTSTQNWVVDDGLTFSGSYLVWWSECRWHTEFNELCALVVTDCKNIHNLATMTIKYQQASSYMVLQQKSMFLHNKIMPLELVCYKTACI